MSDIATLRRILKENHVIAVVGLSANWYRPSYFAAKYLLDSNNSQRPLKTKTPKSVEVGPSVIEIGPEATEKDDGVIASR